MSRIEIIPGLLLDEFLFEAAAAGIAEHAPDLAPLTYERFTDPSGWWWIPDEHGTGYKAELHLLATRERTVRLNTWFFPDLRGGEQSRPHSHPWWFQARVLTAGYTEDRYERTSNTLAAGASPVCEQLGVEHRAGAVNEVPLSVYHEVTEIHEPGRTLSLMICGPGQRGAWGYLDTDTGAHTPTAPDPDFAAKLRHLNPHQY